MKKITLSLLIVFLGLGAFAQKIKTNEVDKFTKNKIIETSFEYIAKNKNSYGGLTKEVRIAFKQIGDISILRLKWSSNKVLAIAENADILFLDSDGNTYPFKSASHIVAEKGAGAIGFVGSGIYGLNINAIGDCSGLQNKKITDMRISTTDGYVDFQLIDNAGEVITKTYVVFEEAVKQ